MDSPTRLHPYLPEAQDLLRQRRISRREFLRLATLLGASYSAARLLAACGAKPTPAPIPPTRPPPATVKRGGVLRSAMQVPAVDHPARFSRTYHANAFRMVFEYLTETDRDNITRPYLLEKWEASDDLQTWTLHLRKGIKWTNGDEFTARDVVFNFSEWLDPDAGSSMLALWQGFLTPNDIETVDEHTVRLHLARPKLDVPENLFHYPAQIMHYSFNGDISTGANPGTGPYLLKEFRAGERVRLERREGYWRNGADGQPLPYLDAIEYVDLGDDQTAAVAAFQSGQVDHIYDLRVESFLALKDDPRARVTSVGTSRANLLRVRVDLEPWKDVRVRQALKLCQNRQKVLQQAFSGEGLVGHDTHVSPVHPEWAPMDPPAYDPERARGLLAEAGYPNGLKLAISVGAGWTDVVAYAEALQQDAKPAGFNITLDAMPNASYLDLWTEAAVGITPWPHYPLAVMVLPLAYTADARGNPVPWNETRWVDREFSDLLLKAQGTLEVEARRAIMKDLERIQSERGSIGVACWRNAWAIYNPALQGAEAHPSDYNLWREVWYDPASAPGQS